MTNQVSKSYKHSLEVSLLFVAAGHIITGLLAEVFFQIPVIPWLVVFIAFAVRIPKNKFRDRPYYGFLGNFLQGCAMTMFLIILVLITGGKTAIFGNIASEAYGNFTRVVSFFLAAAWLLSAFVIFIGGFLGKAAKLDKVKLAKMLFIFGVLVFVLLVVNISVVIPFLKPYDAILILVIFVSIYASIALAGHINGNK